MPNYYEIENLSELYSAIDELETGNLSEYDRELVNSSIDEYRRTHSEEF
jgi:hypothetical protein